MKKTILWTAIAFLGIQLIPVDKVNKAINPQNNFVDIYKTPQPITQILQSACYDCHSNQTHYPSYSQIAPISWAIKDHVNQGRDYLNFSEWGTYNKELKQNALEKSILSVANLQMPLVSYINYHPEANLTALQRKTLENYFSQILEKEKVSQSTSLDH